MLVDLAVLADYAAVTQEGKLVIGGIFDRVMAARMPWQHPSMSLVFRMNVEAGEERQHALRLQCVDPDGAEVIPPLEQRVTAGASDAYSSASANFIFGVGGIVFSRPGRHHFEIFVDGEHVRTVPFEVVMLPEAEGGESEGGPRDPA